MALPFPTLTWACGCVIGEPTGTLGDRSTNPCGRVNLWPWGTGSTPIRPLLVIASLTLGAVCWSRCALINICIVKHSPQRIQQNDGVILIHYVLLRKAEWSTNSPSGLSIILDVISKAINNSLVEENLDLKLEHFLYLLCRALLKEIDKVLIWPRVHRVW